MAITLSWSGSQVEPKHIKEPINVMQKYTLERMRVYYRAPCIHTKGQCSITNPPTGMFWGGNQRTLRNLMGNTRTEAPHTQ